MLRLIHAQALWIFALVLLWSGYSFAQTTIPQVGQVVVPDYIWSIGSLLIGWLVKEISSPLTALLKQRFGFQGNATRYVYVVLSAVFVAGFGLVSGAFGGGSAGWWAAAGALVTAVLKGLGDYVKLQQAAASVAPQLIPTQTPSSSPIPVSSPDAITPNPDSTPDDILPPAGVIQPPDSATPSLEEKK